MGKNLDICDRLKEEREKIGLSQAQFGALAGKTRKTIFGYEAGDRMPDAGALAAWSRIGLDPLYVVTGQRSEAVLSPELSDLIALYQKAPLAVKAAVLRALSGDASETTGVNVRGSNNQIAGRDFNGSK